MHGQADKSRTEEPSTSAALPSPLKASTSHRNFCFGRQHRRDLTILLLIFPFLHQFEGNLHSGDVNAACNVPCFSLASLCAHPRVHCAATLIVSLQADIRIICAADVCKTATSSCKQVLGELASIPHRGSSPCKTNDAAARAHGMSSPSAPLCPLCLPRLPRQRVCVCVCAGTGNRGQGAGDRDQEEAPCLTAKALAELARHKCHLLALGRYPLQYRLSSFLLLAAPLPPAFRPGKETLLRGERRESEGC